MKIAVAQPAPDIVAHAAAVRAARSRVVVFPELSLTGYRLDAPEVSLDALGPVAEACRETGSLALVGAPYDGSITFLAVDPAGVRCVYRKIHLSPEEAERFRAGTDPVVLEVDGWRLGLAICKDFNTPSHAASMSMDAYLAGTVKHAHEAEAQDARAREIALSMGIWVAVASYAGPTGQGYHQTAGNSALWTPGGELAARADLSAIASARLPEGSSRGTR